MKARDVLLMLAVATCAHATGVKRAPHMTGDQFIAKLRRAPNAQRLFDEHYAQCYMAGVTDATQGRNTWCSPSGMKPETVDGYVLDELASRAAGSMPGIASALLLEQYSIKAVAGASGAAPSQKKAVGDRSARRG